MCSNPGSDGELVQRCVPSINPKTVPVQLVNYNFISLFDNDTFSVRNTLGSISTFYISGQSYSDRDNRRRPVNRHELIILFGTIHERGSMKGF